MMSNAQAQRRAFALGYHMATQDYHTGPPKGRTPPQYLWAAIFVGRMQSRPDFQQVVVFSISAAQLFQLALVGFCCRHVTLQERLFCDAALLKQALHFVSVALHHFSPLLHDVMYSHCLHILCVLASHVAVLLQQLEDLFCCSHNTEWCSTIDFEGQTCPR